MNPTNAVFITALSIIALGFFLKNKGIITEKEGKIITKLLMHTTFPSLVFVTVMRVNIVPNLLLLPLICISFSAITMLIGSFIFKSQTKRIRGLLTMSSGGFNLGLFAFPLIEGIWGREGMVYAALFDVGNSIVVFCMVYGTGVIFAEAKEEVAIRKREKLKKAFLKIFTLLPFQAMLLGLFINLTALELPQIVVDIIDILAKGNKVLVLLIMGIYLSLNMTNEVLKKVVNVLIIRYTVGLTMGLLLYYNLPFEPLYRSIVLICLILPVGMTLLPFSDELGYDSKIAGVLVNLSMIISFVLMWGLVLGMHLN
ncbi:AEC family transporter [Flectobacillus major]|jgi:predicted permease|uniref:AEC family transporter n=1 Tax=Flectobacillus major TaxID=103 RepID=UPI0003FE1348|nr:AEC family transporter [Flectobacillus major]